MVVWWSIGAGVHFEPQSHPNEQIVWMLKGKMEFRLGSEQRVCGQGDVVVIPGGTEHEAWFREDTEVIDFFASARGLPTRRQARLYERRLSSSLACSICSTGSAAMRAWVIFNTDAGSAVTAQIASDLLEPTITARPRTVV
jgi:hypothetical protein